MYSSVWITFVVILVSVLLITARIVTIVAMIAFVMITMFSNGLRRISPSSCVRSGVLLLVRKAASGTYGNSNPKPR